MDYFGSQYLCIYNFIMRKKHFSSQKNVIFHIIDQIKDLRVQCKSSIDIFARRVFEHHADSLIKSVIIAGTSSPLVKVNLHLYEA